MAVLTAPFKTRDRYRYDIAKLVARSYQNDARVQDCTYLYVRNCAYCAKRESRESPCSMLPHFIFLERREINS